MPCLVKLELDSLVYPYYGSMTGFGNLTIASCDTLPPVLKKVPSFTHPALTVLVPFFEIGNGSASIGLRPGNHGGGEIR
jgi:hypothetical protein